MKTSFQYNQSQQPIFSTSVMEASLHYRAFTHNTSIRDASFSSYLKPGEPKPTASSQKETVDDSEISIFDAQKYFNEGNNEQKEASRPSSSAPINNLNLEHEATQIPRLSSVSSDGYSRNYRARSFHATPTASSEASWNSQTGLLTNPPGAIAVSMRNLPSSTYQHPNQQHQERRRESGSAKWFFGVKCPCTGKKSLQVEESLPESPTLVNLQRKVMEPATTKTDKRTTTKSCLQSNFQSHQTTQSVTNDLVPGNRENASDVQSSQRVLQVASENPFAPSISRVLASGRPGNPGGFSFPILNQSGAQGLLKKSTTSLEDPPRQSLEVFQPLEEPITKNPTFLGSPISRVVIDRDEDVGSDASSDLFEIESFSTQTTSSYYPMYHRRDSFDDRLLRAATGNTYSRRSLDEPVTSSVAPTECYEPSEASIDWSVTTAEGFDRASSVTNFSISASEIEWHRGGGYGGSGGMEAGGGRRRSGGGNGLLLGCRHEKAVSVGPQPVRVPEEQGAGRGPQVAFPLMSALRHVTGRPGNPNKPPAASSHSDRLSLAFAA